jgi:DNA-binding NarL/FixJ family response regulator
MESGIRRGASSLSESSPGKESMMSRRPGPPNAHTKVAHRARHDAARADVSSALSTRAPLHEQFQACADALARHLDAAAARIWLLHEDGRTLAMQANSGARATPGGGTPHIPVASPALRSIIEEGVPYITHDALNDPQLRDLDWNSMDRMAYAGYPLLVRAEAVGVLAMFSRSTMSRTTLDTLRTLADMLAQAVERVHGKRVPRQSDAQLTETQRLRTLLGTIRRAIHHSPADLNPQMQVLRDRYASLSGREREVMALVVTGRLNKQVGKQLGISEITVKEHRGQVMRKMKAPSLADLVKIAVLLQLAP